MASITYIQGYALIGIIVLLLVLSVCRPLTMISSYYID